jgi:hypothetical protein
VWNMSNNEIIGIFCVNHCEYYIINDFFW